MTKGLLQKIWEMLEKLGGNRSISSNSLGPKLCNKMSCFGTPGEMAKLINAGYGNVLHGVMVEGTVISEGGRMATQRFPMIRLRHDHKGCVMYKNGKCLLMESGLTPAMGAIHLLTNGDMGDLIKEAMIPVLVLEWADRENIDTIRYCMESLKQIQKSGRNHTN